MTRPEFAEHRSKDLVDKLLDLNNDRFEVWKYFEARADQLGERLWSTGTWLMSILVAMLSLPFVAKFIAVVDATFPIQVSSRIPVGLIAGFGIAFCFFSYAALKDLREHIESNWRRSAYALTGQWGEIRWGGRKRHAWNVLLSVGIFAAVAFVSQLILAFLP